MPTTIFALPQEVLEHLLCLTDPLNVAAFAQACRTFRAIVYQPADQHLWRTLYLGQPVDDPRKCVDHLGRRVSEAGINWRHETQRLIRARTVIAKPADCRLEERSTILHTLVDLASHYPPVRYSARGKDVRLSINLIWLVSALCDFSLLDDSTWGDCAETTSLYNQLHTLYGMTGHDIEASQRVASRAYMYDLSRYSPATDYGPLRPDGTVNWEHMRAIHHVMCMHILDARAENQWDTSDFFMTLPFCQLMLPDELDLDHADDWAGVEGIWRVSFAFCDHRDLLAYNGFGNPDARPNIAIIEAEDFEEEFRSIFTKLTVRNIEADESHPTRPIIHFTGQMRESRTMVGQVQMTPDHQVRWSFVSGDDIHPRWSCEAIQIGGIRSARGALGCWTTVAHGDFDPVGPLWLTPTTGTDDEDQD